MTVWVALLRAVNVAGVNRLPMEELRGLLADKGLLGVKTYIQSGNVVFRSNLGATALGPLIADAVLARFGFRPPVLMLSRGELDAAVAANPFATEAPEKVYFFFMERDLPRATGDFLKSVAVPGERYAYRGRVLWLHLPEGMGRSKLAERVMKLPLDITGRNLKSVTAIATLAQKLEAAG